MTECQTNPISQPRDHAVKDWRRQHCRWIDYSVWFCFETRSSLRPFSLSLMGISTKSRNVDESGSWNAVAILAPPWDCELSEFVPVSCHRAHPVSKFGRSFIAQSRADIIMITRVVIFCQLSEVSNVLVEGNSFADLSFDRRSKVKIFVLYFDDQSPNWQRNCLQLTHEKPH